MGWHPIQHEKVPKNATDGWFAVSTGDAVLSFDVREDGVRAVVFDLASGGFRVSDFKEMGHLATNLDWNYAWTGTSLLVFGYFVQGDEYQDEPPRGLVYNLDEDGWTPMSTEGQPTDVGCEAWTGTEFLVFAPDWNGPLRTYAYDPEADRWREREALRSDGMVLVGCDAVWAETVGFVWAYSDTDAPDVPTQFDPQADAWRLLSKDPAVPRRYNSKLAYSSGVILLWGGLDPDPPVPATMSDELPPRRYRVDTDTWQSVSADGPQPEGDVSNVAVVREGALLQGGNGISPEHDFGFLYAPHEDRWFALQQGCVTEPESFFGDLVSTDHGLVLWRGPIDLGEPMGWKYEGPLR